MYDLNISICEDTDLEKENLTRILKESNLNLKFTFYTCGEDLLKAYCNDIDLFLIDIYMDGITGIETAKIIRTKNPYVPISFITKSLDHTLESYRLGALKYIEKPFNKKDIDEIL